MEAFLGTDYYYFIIATEHLSEHVLELCIGHLNPFKLRENGDQTKILVKYKKTSELPIELYSLGYEPMSYGEVKLELQEDEWVNEP
jgi:hypothetical protein